MKELMIHVERIVRPIEAMDEHKDRMREELLAHLTAGFEAELARLGDEASARERAIAQLGIPDQLRGELQDTVSRVGRWKARFERLFNWHAPEPAWKYTLRVGLFTGTCILVLIPLLLPSILWLGVRPALEAVRLLLPIAGLVGLNVFALGFLYFKIRDSLLGAFGVERSWLRVVSFVLASSAITETSLLFYLWTVTGEIGTDLSLFAGRSLICLVMPVVGVFVAWQRGPFELRHAEWECLDISA